MSQFKDQINRTFELKNPPSRIVSLVPSLTELLVDLDLKDQLVGITKFCVHPKDLIRSKTVIGGTKQVHFDKIRNLAPSFILANKEENTPQMIAELEKIAPVYVSDITTIDDMIACINDLGIICNRKKNAHVLIQKLTIALTRFSDFIQTKPRKKVVYYIWHTPWMVVGQNNYINTMLKLNKFENIIIEDRYPELSMEALHREKPDLVLLSSEPYPFNETHRALFKPIPTNKIILVDGEYFSWYGSRFLKALDYFKTLHD
ncbi:helical backbone metal receptor [Flavobacteriaceae bacterium F08102]|nr:helical backbone metal receptor [Flavobacteriaceae bacterium F08102]